MDHFDHNPGFEIDPAYVQWVRHAEIDHAESLVPPDERRVLTPETMKELEEWAKKRIDTICNG